MNVIDSRRLTGPNLITDLPGAVLDITLPDDNRERAVTAWRGSVRAVLDAVGWTDQSILVRAWSGGVSLAITAPIDALYAATEVNEWAWQAAAAILNNEPEPEQAVQRLRTLIEEASNPALIALRDAATAHGVPFLSDDDHVSLGWGTGSMVWPAHELPALDRVPWHTIHDIPAAVVTGTNGKSTTVRLLAAIADAANRTPGICTTDWIMAGDRTIDQGDYSGPGGTRAVLREKTVDIAFLETARGGLLRRGLGCTGYRAALVTNVAEDHLGEYGVHDLHALAQTKLVVAKGVAPGGRLVLNADDPLLVKWGAALPPEKLWFSLSPDHPVIVRHLQSRGDACYVEDGDFILVSGGHRRALARVKDMPVTLNGAARHNTANAAAAIGVAASLGLSDDAIVRGLTGFQATARTNPGRGNLYQIGGVTFLVDFAHNPHGVLALVEMIADMPANRKLIVIGQAGDREDHAIREMAKNAWRAEPDLIVIKEMPAHLRGRQLGEIPALIEDALIEAGAPPERLVHAGSEIEAVEKAIQWARPGDLPLLLLHENRDAVNNLLSDMQRRNWRPGEPIRSA